MKIIGKRQVWLNGIIRCSHKIRIEIMNDDVIIIIIIIMVMMMNNFNITYIKCNNDND